MKKPPRTPRRRRRSKLDDYDEVVRHWQNIVTLAALMQSCGHGRPPGFSRTSQAGTMLLEEAGKLYEHLQALEP